MAFDPDAYLAKKGISAAPAGFDPDAYLAKKKASAVPRDEFGRVIQHGVELDPNFADNEMSTMQKFDMGTAAGLTKLIHGGKQAGIDALAAMGVDVGDAKEKARLQSEEYKKYGADENFAGAAGNVLGNVIGTAPLMMMGPSGAAAGAGGTAKALAALKAIGYGAGEGAATGAIAPVSEEGERAENAMFGGAFGGLIPTAGAAMRSTPFKKTAELAADWNPFSYSSRLAKRNIATETADAIDNARVDWGNELSMARHGAEVEDISRGFTAAKEEAKATARSATAAAKLSERERVRVANSLRNDQLEEARAEVARRAGFTKVPTTTKEVGEELGALGKRYGDTLDEYVVPVKSFARDVAGLADGLPPDEAKLFTKISDKLSSVEEFHGGVPGSMYRTIRADLNDAVVNSRGTAKEHAKLAMDTLDNLLKKAVGDDDKYKQIVQMRDQYALGAKIGKIKPGKGIDVDKVVSRIDAPYANDPTGARDYLTDTLTRLPAVEKAAPVPSIPAASVPEPQYPMAPELLPKFTSRKEEKDILKLAIVNGLMGFGTGGTHLAVAPTMYAMKKAANSKPTSDIVSRLLRGYTQMELSD